MKNSREQFEEWFDEYTFSAPGRCRTLRSGNGYRNVACQEQWEAWQASRAAIEIELPDKVMVEDDFDNGHNCAIDYCADAIHAAGLTVKGDA